MVVMKKLQFKNNIKNKKINLVKFVMKKQMIYLKHVYHINVFKVKTKMMNILFVIDVFLLMIELEMVNHVVLCVDKKKEQMHIVIKKI